MADPSRVARLSIIEYKMTKVLSYQELEFEAELNQLLKQINIG